MGDGANDAGLSRHHLIRACEASLRRLGTDYIDLYQLHEWDGQTPLEETLGALEHLLQSGKVRYVGCSNFAGWQVMKALGIARAEGLPVFVSQQVYLSLQERSAEYEIVPSALDQGLGLLIWSPLAGGLLSGKYRRDQPAPEGSRHATDWDEPPVYDEDKLWDTVDALIEVAEEHGVSAAQVALAWLLGRPAVTSLIVGARTEEQLRDNLAAINLQLSAEEHQRLERVSRPTAHLSVLASEEDRGRSARDRRPVADHAGSPESHGARSTSTQFCPPNQITSAAGRSGRANHRRTVVRVGHAVRHNGLGSSSPRYARFRDPVPGSAARRSRAINYLLLGQCRMEA